MRTTPALRTLAAALLTGGTSAVTAAGTTATAAPPASAEGRGSGGPAQVGETVPGTVTSRTDLPPRRSPTPHAPAVGSLAPGSHDRVLCEVLGQSVNGNPYWYWLVDAQDWASASGTSSGGGEWISFAR
jgi:hypothetical protein